MDLFNNKETNLLPKDGIVNYYERIFSINKSEDYFNKLMDDIEWKNDQAIIYGKLITTKRKVAWYGDADFEYTYSKITKRALPWTPELLEIKQITEQISGEKFNSC